MSIFFASGSPAAVLSDDHLRSALEEAFGQLGSRQRVLAVPPDYSRYASHAGRLTQLARDYFGPRLTDIMPAVGTHMAMTDRQRTKMFGDLPADLFRHHNWRTDVTTIGEVPADYVAEATEGIYGESWPAQLNNLVWQGGHDLVLSIGQVVPHEVIGMANYNKNLFVGTGGVRGINESHYIGAVYGMERCMGRCDTPLRRILNYAQDNFCTTLPVVFVLTVIGPDEVGKSVVRGLFIGDDVECFEQACELSRQVNLTKVDVPLKKAVVYLNPEKFESVWLGNKAIYRTRMAIADGGELVILAPGIKQFGEDPGIDRLIRRVGYRTTPEIIAAVGQDDELRANLAAPAHLIHGSTEGRFRVTYCPGGLSREEIEGVGYEFGELQHYQGRYGTDESIAGFRETADGESYYYIADPAMGLWTA